MPTPIEMPDYIRSYKFDPVYIQQVNPSGEYGFIQTLQRSAPVWMAEYTTGPLSGTRYNEWVTFLDQLEGSMNSFLAYNPRRLMPYAYINLAVTANPWTQTGQTAPRVTNYDYANSTITLDRLQNGVTITAGDLISFQIDGIWYLFRSQTTVNSVSGNGAVLNVKPRPNIRNFIATNIRYRKACIEMKMLGAPDLQDSVDDFPVYTFRAGQYTARAPT